MKCPECVRDGERSIVTIGPGYSTLAYAAPFYDEEGRHHHHDPNVHTSEYSCSRGHSWAEVHRGSC